MNDTGPFFSADLRKSRAMMQQRVHQRVLAVPGSRMDYQPGWLIDHNQVFIFENDLERNRFGLGFDLFHRRLDQLDGVSNSNGIARPRRLPIHGDRAASDELLNS